MKIKKFLCSFFCIVYVTAIILVIYHVLSGPQQIQENVDLNEKIQIIHAAGEVRDSISGQIYLGSNSYEGLKQSYEAGHRLIELDFNFTSDGDLVCIHDWYHYYSAAITDNEALSLSEFMKCKIFERFTPLCLDTLANYLNKHRDLRIVTDVKERNLDAARLIAERYPYLRDQFIIQIYQEDEYEQIRNLGFKNIIFTLYRLEWGEKTDAVVLANFASTHPLLGITFPALLAEYIEINNFIAELKKAEIPIFIHTVNGTETQAIFYDMGVDGIYTDYRFGTEDIPEEIL